jgi:hypothetical protein
MCSTCDARAGDDRLSNITLGSDLMRMVDMGRRYQGR